MDAVRALTDETEDGEPPMFRFITVDGTRLRYLERGTGTPVLLLHGNGSMIEDFVSSGLMDQTPGHRFVAFDRPGFGYSERPRDRSWDPWAQADLLLSALRHLEVDCPVVVGHSWGALVALAMALQSAEKVAGLVLLSGYYYPIPRPQAIRVPAAAFPFVRRLMAPDTVRRVFAPCAVPERFKRTYPLPRAMRLSHMMAVDEEAAMLLGATKVLCRQYRNLSVPVHLIAGSDDRIVDTDRHSVPLHNELSASTFHRIPGCGHMVHHAARDEALAAIAELGLVRRQADAARLRKVVNTPQRQWLHIDDALVAA
jgi:pimeloyl-ACP methyl ester carboxylesterase